MSGASLNNKHIAIIGAGRWGKNLVRNFCELLGADMVTCCDGDQTTLQNMAKSHPGIHTESEVTPLWENDSIQAVVISTPTESHYQIAKSALASGKHVLVEKPVCTSYRESMELCELAEKNGLILMVDHILLYHPAVDELKKRLSAGELGEIRYLYAQRLNLGVIRSHENVLWSLGAHDIAVGLYLLKENPTEVCAQGGVYIQKTSGVHDVALIEMRFPSGKMATLHLSWLDPHKVREITVVGDKKMAVFDDMEMREKLRIYDIGVKEIPGEENTEVRYGEVLIPNIASDEPLRLMCEHFLNCVSTGNKPISDGVVGAKVIRILESANQSLSSNWGRIKINW